MHFINAFNAIPHKERLATLHGIALTLNENGGTDQ
jgi:hypothetical protein